MLLQRSKEQTKGKGRCRPNGALNYEQYVCSCGTLCYATDALAPSRTAIDDHSLTITTAIRPLPPQHHQPRLQQRPPASRTTTITTTMPRPLATADAIVIAIDRHRNALTIYRLVPVLTAYPSTAPPDPSLHLSHPPPRSAEPAPRPLSLGARLGTRGPSASSPPCSSHPPAVRTRHAERRLKLKAYDERVSVQRLTGLVASCARALTAESIIVSVAF